MNIYAQHEITRIYSKKLKVITGYNQKFQQSNSTSPTPSRKSPNILKIRHYPLNLKHLQTPTKNDFTIQKSESSCVLHNHPQQSPDISFIPFERERDNLGKLLHQTHGHCLPDLYTNRLGSSDSLHNSNNSPRGTPCLGTSKSPRKIDSKSREQQKIDKLKILPNGSAKYQQYYKVDMENESVIDKDFSSEKKSK